MLVVVVLWAITPALACLTPAANRSCCQGMGMADCSAPAMMQCGDCCRVQPVDAPQLPGSVRTAEHAVGCVSSPSPVALALPPGTSDAMQAAPEAPLPPGSPGVGSILRI